MRYRLVEVHRDCWAVVDTTIPGGETVAQHAEQGRAEAALRRLEAEAATGLRLAPSEPSEATTDPRREALAGLLAGKASDVRAAVARAGVDDLQTLLELEQQGRGRRTVERAIRERLEAS